MSKVNVQTAGTPKLKISAATRVMSILPRVVENQEAEGHKALRSLAESAAKYAEAQREALQGQTELLLGMLDNILECAIARKGGAKQITNALVDRLLIKAGLRQSTAKVVEGELQIGSKGGAQRFFKIVEMQDKRLWTDKNADALRYIEAHGIPFPGHEKPFTEPFKALRAGIAYTTVHDSWTKYIRGLNQQVNPSPKTTPFERVSTMVVKMKAKDRLRLIALLTPTVSEVGRVESSELVEAPKAEAVAPTAG